MASSKIALYQIVGPAHLRWYLTAGRGLTVSATDDYRQRVGAAKQGVNRRYWAL